MNTYQVEFKIKYLKEGFFSNSIKLLIHTIELHKANSAIDVFEKVVKEFKCVKDKLNKKPVLFLEIKNITLIIE